MLPKHKPYKLEKIKPHVNLNRPDDPAVPSDSVPFDTIEERTLIATELQKPSDVAASKARKFVDFLDKGFTPYEAGKKAHIGPVRSMDKNLKAAVKDLVNRSHLSDEARKMMVRAGLNDIFIGNIF